MRAHELIEILSEVPADTKIMLSSDPEGNSYDWLHAADLSDVEEDSDGELHPVHPNDVDPDETYEKALVLWP